jgi:CubicO group peptidase (beta-lactamase class C family)
MPFSRQAAEVAAEMNLDPGRWQRALELAKGWCEQDAIPSLGFVIGRPDRVSPPILLGRQSAETDAPPIREDAIFLIASITKPLVAMGAMLLVERGQLLLNDRVGEIIPEFAQSHKIAITIRNLLTHTSGLPDMLPNNRQLRAAHAPLATFVENTCAAQTTFPPGRGVQYQSMGFAVLGEIIQRISGQTCAEFLQREFFTPLGMSDTALGAPDDWLSGPKPQGDRIAGIRVPEDQVGEDWNWNSKYWRQLGAPWGGLLTTPADLARYARMMLNHGRWETAQILSPMTVEAATQNQLKPLRDVPEMDRRCRPWGYGWRLHWPAHSANFGDLVGPRTSGHWGATGTVLWIDPDRKVFAVIFTTQPQEPLGTYIARLSNALSASVL